MTIKAYHIKTMKDGRVRVTPVGSTSKGRPLRLLSELVISKDHEEAVEKLRVTVQAAKSRGL